VSFLRYISVKEKNDKLILNTDNKNLGTFILRREIEKSGAKNSNILEKVSS
jgi:hypothetical protein